VIAERATLPSALWPEAPPLAFTSTLSIVTSPPKRLTFCTEAVAIASARRVSVARTPVEIVSVETASP
jgi:hypothetical protein